MKNPRRPHCGRRGLLTFLLIYDNMKIIILKNGGKTYEDQEREADTYCSADALLRGGACLVREGAESA